MRNNLPSAGKIPPREDINQHEPTPATMSRRSGFLRILAMPRFRFAKRGLIRGPKEKGRTIDSEHERERNLRAQQKVINNAQEIKELTERSSYDAPQPHTPKQIRPELDSELEVVSQDRKDDKPPATIRPCLEEETETSVFIEEGPQLTTRPRVEEEVRIAAFKEDVEEKVKQLTREFSAHLTAELSDGARRDHIERSIRHHVRSVDETAISEALQAVAASSAALICDHFGEQLRKEIDSAVTAPWRAQSEPKTETEYQNFLTDFTTQHLPQFYNSNNESVQNLASKAAETAGEETGISHKLIPGLAKLALYDFIFLCDDSGSMQDEDRILVLRDTVGRVAKFATILSSSGISIRMLNYNHDENGMWDHLSSDDAIQKMDRVSYNGGTPLGTRLWSKILKPLVINKAISGKLEKPVIVVIITDGEANNENETQLRDNIYHCNTKMRELGYGDAAVVFLISRVGTSEVARIFVEGLGKDELIGETVYVSPADLQLKRAAFQNSGNDVAYTELLIQLFLAALHVRTKN